MKTRAAKRTIMQLQTHWTVRLLLVVLGAAGPHIACGSETTPVEFELVPIVVGAPTEIEVQPAELHLQSARHRGQLVVTGHYADGHLQDLTRAAEFSSSNAQVAQVKEGVVVPVGDGVAEITVSAGSLQQAIVVEVTNSTVTDPVSFRYETLAAITRQGCNSGACHGSPSGKAGFRLSLAAYDAKLDEFTLTRESFGRRVNVLDPGSSLLLQKPTMRVPHGGGVRLRTHDPAYQVLHRWISEGCQVDSAETADCVRVEVLPSERRVLKRPAHTQQLVVRAHFSDGTIRDVTPLAKFTSSDDTVAGVSADGLVVGHDRGQVAIMVRYLHHVESVAFTLVKDIDQFVWTNPPENNYVDTLVNQKLQQLQYLPSALCSESQFVRRVYLDAIGILPTAEEAMAFLSDPSSDKRTRLVDELLERDEYASLWALRWGDLLRMQGGTVTYSGLRKYHAWVVAALKANMPFDQFARKLLTAQGGTFTNPAANYYRAFGDTITCTEGTAQVFMGVRIQCAKCHNHPFDRWTQDDYYGMSAVFNRVQRKEGIRPLEFVVWMARSGEVTQPHTGKQVQPWVPIAGTLPDQVDKDRRQVFADWLVDADNPFFARVAVNRIWGHVMGQGIVEPVDDFRDSNPPSNPELLDRLATDFVEHGFDQKHILRTIFNSRTYQLSSASNRFNVDDTRLFSHAKIRMLGAEQLLEAICHLTGVSETFGGLPVGTRVTAIPGPDLSKEFLKMFGQPGRETTCACERSTESNLNQAMELSNGSTIYDKLQNKTNRFHKLLAEGIANDEIVTLLYQSGLSRQPKEEELAAAVHYIDAREDRAGALADVCWALINTKEFLFQH